MVAFCTWSAAPPPAWLSTKVLFVIAAVELEIAPPVAPALFLMNVLSRTIASAQIAPPRSAALSAKTLALTVTDRAAIAPPYGCELFAMPFWRVSPLTEITCRGSH